MLFARHRRSLDLGLAFGCALLLALLIALSHPFAETGIVDEFAYAETANLVAHTGHIAYNGWPAMPLTWLLYWGALFIRMFGYTFLTLRVAMLALAMGNTFLTHRILRRCGLSLWNSTFGTLALTLSPLYFAMAFVYMTDIPGLLAIEVAIYCVLRAWQADSDRSATGWLLLALIGNMLLGSTRQISLLGVFVLVPCATYLLRKRKGLFPCVAFVWLLCVLAIGALLLWFSRQPYIVHEPLLPKALRLQQVATELRRAMMSLVLYTVPVVAIFFFVLAWRRKRVWGTLALCLIALLPFAIRWLHLPVDNRITAPFTADTVSPYGLHNVWTIIGGAPVLLTMLERVVLTVLTCLLLVGFALYFLIPGAHPRLGEKVPGAPSMRVLLVLFVPFSASYLALYATRTITFDRYLLPIQLLFAIFLLRILATALQRRDARAVACCLLAVLAAFDVASNHDIFALYEARGRAADELLQAGIPRSRFSAGFEYDGLTEIRLGGYVKEPRLTLRPGEVAYRKLPNRPCRNSFTGETPSLHPEFIITAKPMDCMEATGFPQVHYRTWLNPADRTLRIGRLKPEAKPSQQDAQAHPTDLP